MSKLTKKIKVLKAGDVIQHTGDKLTDEQIKLGQEAAQQKSETGHNPASWVADEDIWDKAKEAAGKTYSESDDAYWPSVTHIYEKMGGTIKSKGASAKSDFLKCYAPTAISEQSQWKQGEVTSFCYMPAGVHTITAGFRGKAITITVSIDRSTADTVQASFESLKSDAPKQKPFMDLEHREEDASAHPVGFSWGKHLGDEGVICSCEPTALGERNVNGKIQSSFSPSFATDADYSKAKFDGSVYTFPEGVRGSASNPARITGIDFCVGTLTNKPAFRAMPPVKAKKQEPVKANEQIYDVPAPVQGDGQQDYTDLAKCAEYKTKVAEAAEEIYGEGEKHGKKFKLHNEAAMAHKAAAETCPEAECRKQHEEAASEHQERALSHGKIVASRKANKLTIQAAIASYESAKITAEESCKYDDAKKAADLATKVAAAHEEIYPDGEKHGTKCDKHSMAAEAHKYAAKLAGDTHDIERHSEAMKGHTIEAERHAKVKAASKEQKEVVKAQVKVEAKPESTKASIPTSAADILASIPKPVSAASILDGLKASKPADKKPEAKPAKPADTKSILASLAHAKSN